MSDFGYFFLISLGELKDCLGQKMFKTSSVMTQIICVLIFGEGTLKSATENTDYSSLPNYLQKGGSAEEEKKSKRLA